MRYFSKILFILTVVVVVIVSCGSDSPKTNSNNEEIGIPKIVSVSTSGNENAYTFSIGIESPDTGCEQYANWWEIVSENGDLIYRRILGHSHVNEQPFIRSGGIVSILENQIITIRVHMNNTGYSVNAYKGSVNGGFTVFTTPNNYASNLETQQPQPTGCAF